MNQTLPLTHLGHFILILIPVILVGALLPLLGRTRRGVLFGVTVPLDFAASEIAQASIRRYRMRSASLVIAALLIVLACVFLKSENAASLVSPVALMLAAIGSVFLLLQEHRTIKPYAVSVPVVRTAELNHHSSLAPILATAAAEIPLAIEALWLRLHWNLIPAQWPKHWDAAGVANSWGTRTPAGVFSPLLMGTITLLVFILITTFMVKGSGTQARQRARTAVPVAALAWIISALFCFVGLLPIWHNISPASIVSFVVAYTAATFAIVTWLLWRSNLMPGTLAAEPYDGTPDSGWRAGGFIYFNPADAALLVPKRYSWGWTLNFARPSAWFLLGAVILLPIISIAFPILLR